MCKPNISSSSQLRGRAFRLTDKLTSAQLHAQRELDADCTGLKSKGPLFRKGQSQYMGQGMPIICRKGEATRVPLARGPQSLLLLTEVSQGQLLPNQALLAMQRGPHTLR